MRRARRIVGALLALSGAGVLADAAITVVWQEPVGALQARDSQRTLRAQYATLVGRYDDTPAPAAASGPEAADRSRHRARRRAQAALVQRERFAGRLNTSTPSGDALGRLDIKRIGLSEVWVQGTDGGALAKGPGHYPSTVLPGRHGTVGLAGHRTTHGAPFRHIDRLRRGDPIDVTMPYGAYRYVVERTRIVAPDRVHVLDSVDSDRLVLTACHPLWSAAQRIVVTARLVRWPAMARPE